jgi:hypothetical protein
MMSDALAGIAGLEGHFAANRRDTDAVAVAGNSSDHPFEQPRHSGRVKRPEPERIHQRNRARPHRKDVADDSADPRRGPLIRLDERGMVVGFDLEHRGEPVADVDGTGILAGALQHLRPFGGQRAQVNS